jgi:tetratricopeptide (TPR) repeat protein/O-antigen ligase
LPSRPVIVGLYVSLLAPVLLPQSYEGWPLAAVQLCIFASVLIVVVGLAQGISPPYRRGPLDLPILGFVLLALVQLVVGNHTLVRWALAPPVADRAPATLPTPMWILGTVYPRQTLESLMLLLAYAGFYVVVVVAIRRRRQLEWLIQALVLCGSVLAFLGLLDSLAGSQWFEWWNEGQRSRVTATFINPDHFANWLVMIICLGGGYLAARHRARAKRSWTEIFRAPKVREEAIRQYLPAVGLVVMAVALVFTLGRGALLGFAVALVALLALLTRMGRLRWTLMLVGTLGIITLCYAGWIGLTPLVERVSGEAIVGRWIQWQSTVPMLRDFPLLGVGLGAYRDIYARYQPLALDPAQYFYPYAHNDVLQLLVETGPLGALLAAWAIVAVLRHLHRHLVGPEHRTDPFSVGIAIGAATGLLAFAVHGFFDFSARIPANGLLAAALLGVMRVALETRFVRPHGDEPSEAREAPARPAAWLPITVAAAVAGLVAFAVLRTAVDDTLLELSKTPGDRALKVLDVALAIDSDNAAALRRRARFLTYRATSPESGAAAPRSVEDLKTAVTDGRRALALRPANGAIHEGLGVSLQALAEREAGDAPTYRAQALTHLARAVALSPGASSRYATLAHVAASPPRPDLQMALAAAGQAIRRDPDWLPGLAERLLPLRPSSAQWSALAPPRLVDQLELASWLESQDELGAAEVVYRRAVTVANGTERPLALWMLARLLLRRAEAGAATHALETALALSPSNPELHLTRADAVARSDPAAALEDYRQAAALASAQAEPDARRSLFNVEDRRLLAVIATRRDGATDLAPLRYVTALGRYLNDRRLWTEALDAWGAVTAQAPDDAAAHFAMGAALDGLGRRAEALAAYQQAVRRDGGTPRYRMRLASRLWEAEQYYQAIGEWRAVVAAEPKNVEALLALARAYERVGDRVEAFTKYRAVADADPGNPEARRALARFGAL